MIFQHGRAAGIQIGLSDFVTSAGQDEVRIGKGSGEGKYKVSFQSVFMRVTVTWKSAWVGEHHMEDARVEMAASTVLCAPSGGGRFGDR